MLRFLKSFFKSRKAQGMVEYGLIIALVIAIVVVVIALLSGGLETLFGGIATKLGESVP